MSILVTGAGGTVGRRLMVALEQRGERAVGWDRAGHDPRDPDAVDVFVRALRPRVIYHLAIASRPAGGDGEGERIGRAWPEQLARLARELGARLVFTSTAMVFTNDAVGPITVDAEPDAREGYGLDKRIAERRVAAVAPDAVIARLGWQIGDAPGSNNMIDYLDERARTHGYVAASAAWLPACSLLDDTAQALLWASEQPGGLYMIDSNRKWSFYAIARALARRHGDRWRVERTDEFVYDQRMIDDRVPIPPLERRLPELTAGG